MTSRLPRRPLFLFRGRWLALRFRRALMFGLRRSGSTAGAGLLSLSAFACSVPSASAPWLPTSPYFHEAQQSAWPPQVGRSHVRTLPAWALWRSLFRPWVKPLVQSWVQPLPDFRVVRPSTSVPRIAQWRAQTLPSARPSVPSELHFHVQRFWVPALVPQVAQRRAQTLPAWPTRWAWLWARFSPHLHGPQQYDWFRDALTSRALLQPP